MHDWSAQRMNEKKTNEESERRNETRHVKSLFFPSLPVRRACREVMKGIPTIQCGLWVTGSNKPGENLAGQRGGHRGNPMETLFCYNPLLFVTPLASSQLSTTLSSLPPFFDPLLLHFPSMLFTKNRHAVWYELAETDFRDTPNGIRDYYRKRDINIRTDFLIWKMKMETDAGEGGKGAWIPSTFRRVGRWKPDIPSYTHGECLHFHTESDTLSSPIVQRENPYLTRIFRRKIFSSWRHGRSLSRSVAHSVGSSRNELRKFHP